MGVVALNSIYQESEFESWCEFGFMLTSGQQNKILIFTAVVVAQRSKCRPSSLEVLGSNPVGYWDFVLNAP